MSIFALRVQIEQWEREQYAHAMGEDGRWARCVGDEVPAVTRRRPPPVPRVG